MHTLKPMQDAKSEMIYTIDHSHVQARKQDWCQRATHRPKLRHQEHGAHTSNHALDVPILHPANTAVEEGLAARQSCCSGRHTGLSALGNGDCKAAADPRRPRKSFRWAYQNSADRTCKHGTNVCTLMPVNVAHACRCAMPAHPFHVQPTSCCNMCRDI